MLYIDTDEEEGQLESAANQAKRMISGPSGIKVLIFRNEDFDESARDRYPYDFIEASRYYAEVGLSDGESMEADAYQSGVAAIVKELRNGGRFVTASCDFEDAIADATGWNWTESNPEPPGRARLR
jgi:hypothetical protein